MKGRNVVLLESDLAAVFPDSESVNAALRQYLSDYGSPSSKTAAIET